jgi:hypothetical protein
MNFEINTVYTIKLNSGEEMVTKVIGINDDSLSITDPVSIAPSQKGMQMIPSMFTADPSQPTTLNTNSISFYCITEDSIKMKYIEATTGITIPDKKIILG